MNLQNLIDKKDLVEIEDISIGQIKKRFSFATSNFNTAKKLLDSEINRDEEYNEMVYTNIYKSARLLLETFLLLNGFRIKTKYGHHEIVIHWHLNSQHLLLDHNILQFSQNEILY